MTPALFKKDSLKSESFLFYLFRCFLDFPLTFLEQKKSKAYGTDPNTRHIQTQHKILNKLTTPFTIFASSQKSSLCFILFLPLFRFPRGEKRCSQDTAGLLRFPCRLLSLHFAIRLCRTRKILPNEYRCLYRKTFILLCCAKHKPKQDRRPKTDSRLLYLRPPLCHD